MDTENKFARNRTRPGPDGLIRSASNSVRTRIEEKNEKNNMRQENGRKH